MKCCNLHLQVIKFHFPLLRNLIFQKTKLIKNEEKINKQKTLAVRSSKNDMKEGFPRSLSLKPLKITTEQHPSSHTQPPTIAHSQSRLTIPLSCHSGKQATTSPYHHIPQISCTLLIWFIPYITNPLMIFFFSNPLDLTPTTN